MGGLLPCGRLGAEPRRIGVLMRTLFTRLRWMTQRRRKEAELRAELDFHVAEESEAAMTRGLAEDEARVAARQHLGNRGLVEDDARGSWRLVRLQALSQDRRCAGRPLR